MKELFKIKKYKTLTQDQTLKFSAPSNIALVKYWGKKSEQLPVNASLSFTLTNCKTITSLQVIPKNSKGISFQFFYDGFLKESFHTKLEQFFDRILPYCSYLEDYQLVIDSMNTFPHSSGIASSASAMAALSSTIIALEKQIAIEEKPDKYYLEKASFLARLGSGSACRSIQGKAVLWGESSSLKAGSDYFGLALDAELASMFLTYQDTILLVDKGEKQVSSSVGHQLMNGHPFAENRFYQAEENILKLKEVLTTGNLESFIQIVESEALTLHAMMMTSSPYFILMKPNTLEIIQKIWHFRAKTKIPVCFTLDAGANVHVLYPEKDKETVRLFIDAELLTFCQNQQCIHDEVGFGAKQI